MPPLLSVTVENGKYTVQMDAQGNLTALRHGKPWRELAGDKLVLALANEVDNLRAQIEVMTGQITH